MYKIFSVVLLDVYSVCFTVVSRYSHWLQAGQFGDRIPVEGDIFRTCPIRPWGPPSPYTMGTGSFPRVKATGAWR